MTDYECRVSELFGTFNPERIEFFINELSDYGIDSEEQLDDAYYGCYPSAESFVEDLCEDCYSDVISALPVFMQTALDYELMWHQSFQHDFFTIYDRDSGDYYFFNRNFWLILIKRYCLIFNNVIPYLTLFFLIHIHNTFIRDAHMIWNEQTIILAIVGMVGLFSTAIIWQRANRITSNYYRKWLLSIIDVHF